MKKLGIFLFIIGMILIISGLAYKITASPNKEEPKKTESPFSLENTRKIKICKKNGSCNLTDQEFSTLKSKTPIKEVQEDHELCQYLIEQNIYYLPYIKDASIRDNPQYIIQYVKKYPHTFSKYLDKISNHLTADLLEVVIKSDFQNYKLIDKDNPLMKQFYESLDRVKKVRPELKMDNPNLRYELLMDSEFVKLDINIINSLLEYNTGNTDKIIQIRNDGKLDYLIKYIEQYSNLYGNNLENIQNAISTFDKIEDLLINTNNFDGLTEKTGSWHFLKKILEGNRTN